MADIIAFIFSIPLAYLMTGAAVAFAVIAELLSRSAKRGATGTTGPKGEQGPTGPTRATGWGRGP